MFLGKTTFTPSKEIFRNEHFPVRREYLTSPLIIEKTLQKSSTDVEKNYRKGSLQLFFDQLSIFQCSIRIAN